MNPLHVWNSFALYKDAKLINSLVAKTLSQGIEWYSYFPIIISDDNLFSIVQNLQGPFRDDSTNELLLLHFVNGNNSSLRFVSVDSYFIR